MTASPSFPRTEQSGSEGAQSPGGDIKALARWRRLSVVASLLALIALLAVSTAILSQVEPAVVGLSASLITVLFFAAVLFGLFRHDAHPSHEWNRLALRWVNFFSETNSRTAWHISLMFILILLVGLGGLGSLYSDVQMNPVSLSQPQRYKIKAHNFYGRTVDVAFDSGLLKPAWFPFGMFRGAFLGVWQSNTEITKCSIRHQTTVCLAFKDSVPADYLVRSLSDSVDFTDWQPFSIESNVANSIVKRRFDMMVERQTNHEFIRWSATASRFPQDCQVLSGNAECEKRPLGTFESNKQNSAIVIKDQDSFPIGIPTPLNYSVQYKNIYTFTATEQENECIDCNVLFISVYPIKGYHLTMTFPKEWSWQKVILKQAGNPDVTTINANSSSTFTYTAESLPAGVHLTFLIFPDDRLPKFRTQ